MTALGAAALDDGATAPGAHAGTKPVLALTAAYIWLIGAFHRKRIQIRGVGERRQVTKYCKSLSKRSATKPGLEPPGNGVGRPKREKFVLAAKERLGPIV